VRLVLVIGNGKKGLGFSLKTSSQIFEKQETDQNLFPQNPFTRLFIIDIKLFDLLIQE